MPYTVGDDGVIAFGEPVKVTQEFVPDRHPAGAGQPAEERRGLAEAAQDFVRATGCLFGRRDAIPAETRRAAVPAAVSSLSNEGWLLQAPLRVYRDDGEERYVVGLVLTSGRR